MNVFIYWENKHKKTPYYITLCIEKMKLLFPNLIILSPTNIRQYIPHFPKYFQNIKKIALKVDYIRTAVLFYHSGIYLDCDTILFPSFLSYLSTIPTNYQLIGLGKNNIISNNAFLIAPQKNAQILKSIIEEQEKIINKKKGKLDWTDIGGQLIEKISEKNVDVCLTLNPSPLGLFGWQNADVFWSKEEEVIERYRRLVEKYFGVMLYNNVMGKKFRDGIEEGCLLWYLIK